MRRLYVFSGIFNFVVTVPFLINSVLHHLFDVPSTLIDWARDQPPSKPFIFWTFLGFGVLWGVFFLYIAAKPVHRRPWMWVAIAEKLLATVAVWTDYLVFHNIGPRLPLLVLVTDLAFVFAFGWALHATRDAVDAAARDTAARIPVGSAPPARWLLRVVSIPTIVVTVVAVVASLVGGGDTDPRVSQLRPGHHLHRARDDQPVVGPAVRRVALGRHGCHCRRRHAVGVGRRRSPARHHRLRVVARLIPVATVGIGWFSDSEGWRPTVDFLWLVIVGELFAAFLIWLALRSANASALALGAELEPRPAVSATRT